MSPFLTKLKIKILINTINPCFIHAALGNKEQASVEY